MEFSSIRYNKTGFLPSCGCIHTTVWMHCRDTNKMHREKARWELHKNATSYLTQILEAAPCETTSVQPLISHLANHPNKMNKACGTLLEKKGWIHKWHFSMDSHTWRCLFWPKSKNLFTLARCGHIMSFERPARNNGWKGWMKRESGKSTMSVWQVDDIRAWFLFNSLYKS